MILKRMANYYGFKIEITGQDDLPAGYVEENGIDLGSISPQKLVRTNSSEKLAHSNLKVCGSDVT